MDLRRFVRKIGTSKMEKFTLFLLMPGVALAVCDPKFEQVGEKCLRFETEFRMTFAEAHEVCISEHGATLAVIDSAQHFKDIVDHIHSKEDLKESFWIDGMDVGHDGHWTTREGENFPMGTPFWAGFPDYQEPSGGTKENCAHMSNGQRFYINDIDCNSAYWFICEQANNYEKSNKNVSTSDSPCPFHYVRVGSKCLSFLNQYELPWNEASLQCGYLDPKGELAFVNDIELLRAIFLHLEEEWMTDHHYWIGGTDEGHEGNWTWTDGSAVPMGTPFWGLYNGGQEPAGGSTENYLFLSNRDFYFRDNIGSTLLTPLCQMIE
ncbi:uncharacterized protein [Palaemon carinicauda]|uniref:uncharacterized protein isoform X4 n=1 Tax=Palaemon carinicauda TaxID=392227 RepID=UPI0035B66C7F